MVSQEEKHSIALDLVNKYPAGPNKLFKRKHYEMQHRWHWLFERYTDIPFLSSAKINTEHREFWGYDPTVLFSLHIDSEYAARSLLKEAYEGDEAKKKAPSSYSAMSRRARLLYYRIKNASDYVRKHGGQGIYELSWHNYGYRYPKAYVAANTMKEAYAVGEMLKGLYGVPSEQSTRASYHTKGEAIATLGMNTEQASEVKNTAEREVARIKKHLAEAQERAEKAAMVSMMIYQNALTLAGVEDTEDE